jgi:hypothetical protein
MYLVDSIKARRILPGLGQAYLSFLGLYWMTAPLAWLYGIPYERFLNEVDAANANVWTLEFVSIWRVLLMSRVYAVLVGSSFLSVFSKLGTFALALVYIALIYARMPLVDWMGGVRVPPSVEPVASAYLFVTFFGFFGLVVGALVVLGSLFVATPEWTLDGFQKVEPGEVGRDVWATVLMVIVIFGASLPMAQREQRLRYEVETDYKSGKIDEALAILATHTRGEFPPQWTPPPWPEYEDGARDPSLTTIRAFAGENSAGQGTGTSPDQTGKTRLRVEFENPNHSFIVLQTTLGTGECSANPVLYSPRLDGDAGWVLTTFARDDQLLPIEPWLA